MPITPGNPFKGRVHGELTGSSGYRSLVLAPLCPKSDHLLNGNGSFHISRPPAALTAIRHWRIMGFVWS